MRLTPLRATLLVTWIAFAVGSPRAEEPTGTLRVAGIPHAVTASATLASGETEGEHELFGAIGQGELTAGIVVGALALAFGLGALHALSPGHGKALVAAYLVGSRGTVAHAVALGGIVTFTHVFSVLVLGLIALLAADHFVPEQLTPVLGAASGLLIVVVGIFMFRRALRRRRDPANHEHPHSHTHDTLTPHPGSTAHPSAAGGVTLGSLVALGVSGGMVPCPSALVVLLTAVALQRIALGLALVLAFSLGLAAVLIVIGVLLVSAQGFMERFAEEGRVTRAAAIVPLVSATIVTTVGAVICWHSLLDAGKVLL